MGKVEGGRWGKVCAALGSYTGLPNHLTVQVGATSKSSPFLGRVISQASKNDGIVVAGGWGYTSEKLEILEPFWGLGFGDSIHLIGEGLNP